MSALKVQPRILLKALSSSKLAIALVLLLILFSLAGAVLPQEGSLESAAIQAWQEAHPAVTALFEPVGLFRVFHSWPFFLTILILGVNTLTCTILHFLGKGGFSSLKGPEALRTVGFLFVHLSLLTLFTGGFLSAAASMDGYIVLTEGQRFNEEHNGYLRIVEGPLRAESHEGFALQLKEVRIRYEKKRFPVDVTSRFDILADGKTVTGEGFVRVNEPLSYRGISFTQDKTGFSPHLAIRDASNGRLLVDSFVALKTFGGAVEREYKDFLPLPFLKERIVVTLYPSFRMENGERIKDGEVPDNPLLILETEDEKGNVTERKYLTQGERISLGDHGFQFKDLRQWSSFRVSRDPGYPLVWFSLWVGVGALFLRYIPDLRKWFSE
jgi:cytochrome c biogenesis protein ResB